MDSLIDRITSEFEAGTKAWDDASDYTAATIHLERALELSKRHDGSALVGCIQAKLGLIHTSNGQHRKAIQYFERALETKSLNLDDVFSVRKDLASAYASLNEPEKALLTLREAFVHCPELSATQMAQLLNHTAYMYSRMGDFNGAIEHIEKALGYYRACGNQLGEYRMLCNLVAMYKAIDNVEGMRRHRDDLMRMSPLEGSPSDIAEMLLMRATAFNDDETRHLAVAYAEEAYAIATEHCLQSLSVIALISSTRILFEHGDYDGAVRSGLRAEILAKEAEIDQDRVHMLGIYRFLSGSYAAKGDHRNAYDYLKKYLDLKGEIDDAERCRIVAEMRAQFDIEQSDREQERLQRELARRESEVSLQAANVAEKVEALSAVLSQLRKALDAPDQRAQLRNVIRSIEERLGSESDWKMFEAQFKYIHAEFLPILTSRYPSLTLTEVKVCAYTRLNLGTKQIATLLSVDPRTIQNHRLNIRKKIEISGKTDLLHVLMQLGK